MKSVDVYLVMGKRKPFQVPGATISGRGKLPATYEHDGQTFYFATCDISRRTVTYADVDPAKPRP